MIRPIMRNELFLSQPAQDVDVADAALADDLLDTLAAHAHECVGMAANMIGVRKRAIVFDNEGVPEVMFNPEIVKATGEYAAREGCLSLAGERDCTRYRTIEVAYLDRDFAPRKKTFRGFTAQAIQHEVDHTKGIVI